MNPKTISFISELDNLIGLAPKAREKMETVTEQFAFRANEYYLSLIDWKDGHDPLCRIAIPGIRKPDRGGSADPSGEKDSTGKPYRQHKYGRTGSFLRTGFSAGICRPVFRKCMFLSCEFPHGSRQTCSGLAKRVRLIISRASSKIGMVGKSAEDLFLRYNPSADPANAGKFMVFWTTPVARWADDCCLCAHGFRTGITDGALRG